MIVHCRKCCLRAGCSQRKKSGKAAVCEICNKSLAGVSLKRLSCDHIFHDACVEVKLIRYFIKLLYSILLFYTNLTDALQSESKSVNQE